MPNFFLNNKVEANYLTAILHNSFRLLCKLAAVRCNRVLELGKQHMIIFINKKLKENLFEKYKAFYLKVINEESNKLSNAELLAIGQKVYDDIFNKVMIKLNYTEKNKTKLYNKLKKIIKRKYKNTLWDSEYLYNGEFFKKK
jgi:hypothetical protein